MEGSADRSKEAARVNLINERDGPGHYTPPDSWNPCSSPPAL